MNIREKEAYAQAVVMTIAAFIEARPALAPTEKHLKLKQADGKTAMSPKGVWAFNRLTSQWMPPDFVNDANACELVEENFKLMGYLPDYTRFITNLVSQQTPFTEIDEADSEEVIVQKTAYNTGLLLIAKSNIRAQAMFMLIKRLEKQRKEEVSDDEGEAEKAGNIIQMP